MQPGLARSTWQQRAQAALTRRDWPAAEEALGALLRADAQQPRIWLALGEVQEQLGNWPAAEACWREASERAPQLAEAHYNRARALRALGLREPALEALARAIALRADDVNALHLRAMFEEEGGDLPAALATLDLALRLAPQRATLHHNRAVALHRSERHAESLAAHEKAQALGLDAPDAHYNQGNTLQALGRGEEAKAAYRRALARAPQHELALYDLARLRWALGEPEFSAELEAAELAAPNSPVAWGIHAQLLLKAGRPQESAAAYERAAALAPGASGYWDGLAQSLSLLGRHAEAWSAHERAAQLAPQDVNVRCNAAHSLLAAGRAQEAVAHAEAACALAPDNQQARALLGLAWRILGDEREAWLNDYARFVRVFDLDLDADFNAALAKELGALHTDREAPIDQTLRQGTQTRGNLLDQPHARVGELKTKLSEAITRYVSELPADSAHPFLRRRAADWHYAASWSSRLRSQGFHTNHVHTLGWISACYYVAVPPAVQQGEAGWLKFGEPDMDLGLPKRQAVQPRPGRLVLFPSYVWHGTVPFEDSAPRLTVAFDVRPTP
ncbi:MAG TPA: tetratricopeptide repeat protein [Burkholderiaceae bacterium]|jgi:tetratricopeptide (TPR) repeat protein